MLYYQNAHHHDVIFFTFYGNHQSIVKIVSKNYLIKALKMHFENTWTLHNKLIKRITNLILLWQDITKLEMHQSISIFMFCRTCATDIVTVSRLERNTNLRKPMVRGVNLFTMMFRKFKVIVYADHLY